MGIAEKNWIDDLTHYTDGSPRFDYLTVSLSLYKLPWSLQECVDRVSPKGAGSIGSKRLFSRHGILQLALWATPPFYGAPDGYIIDQYNLKDRTQKRREHRCDSLPNLIDALAVELLRYEKKCQDAYQWGAFQLERDDCIRFLRNQQSLFDALRRRNRKRKNPTLHGKKNPENDIQKMIEMIEAVSYADYQHAGAQTNDPGDPRAQMRKWDLLRNMRETFSTYQPIKWSQMATYRALSAIANDLWIHNSDDKLWTPGAVKRLLARGPDPRLRLVMIIERPETKYWYTRPE